MRTTSNQKYEITEISHEKYPFLHRIRALRDIGKKVKAGELGGFVESESNLSFETGDDAYIRGSNLCGHARVSDCGMVLDSPDTGRAPILSGTCAVYGRVCGDVHLTDTALVISGEEICNDSLDTLVMDGKSRSVIRDSSRDELAPQQPPPPTPQKQKGREMSR